MRTVRYEVVIAVVTFLGGSGVRGVDSGVEVMKGMSSDGEVAPEPAAFLCEIKFVTC